jgi:hypothetical protein
MKWIFGVPKPRVRASLYRIPATPPLFRTAERVVEAFIKEKSTIAIIHPPRARLRVVVYGTGLIRVGDTVFSVEPSGTQTTIIGSRFGVTIIRAEPFDIMYIIVEVLRKILFIKNT